MKKTRLDLFLASRHPHHSRTHVKKLIEEGFVLIDGEKKKPGHLLHGGEKIEMIRRAPEIPKAEAEAIPLKILYEDQDLLVIDKAAGMVVHPAPGNVRRTLVNAILYHLAGSGPVTSENFSSAPSGVQKVPLVPPDPIRPGIVHRLDKGTSGVMVVAKNGEALKDLSDQFKQRRVEKTYVALVSGKFPQKSGTISSAIGRDPFHRRKFSSRTKRPRAAVTRFKVLREFPRFSLVELHPETGRTHQIRVHLSEGRHPVVGDTLYGGKSELSPRPLLHAARIEFTHPRKGNRVLFEAPFPDDFREVLGNL